MSVPAVAGGRTSQQFVRYLAQQVAALGSDPTDFNRLSVLRTIAELQALLSERFEEELLVMNAEGVDRAAYRSFGFNAKAASKAYGQVTFTRTFSGTELVNGTAISALTLPAGTGVVVPNTSRQFNTYQDITFAGFVQGGIANPSIAYPMGYTPSSTTYQAGLWRFGYTFINASGETQLSPTTSLTLPVSNAYGISVPAIAMPAGATGVNYYLLGPSASVFGFAGTSAVGNVVTLTITPNTLVFPPAANTTGGAAAITSQAITTTVVANGTGSAFNTNAGTLTQILNAVGGQGVVTASNTGDIITGTDDETDEARRLRFAAFIQGIHRATSEAIEHGVTENAVLLDGYGVVTERVGSAQCVDTAIPGIATLYVWNKTALSAPAVSAPLKALAQQVVNGYTDTNGVKYSGYKAAGALVNVTEATIIPATVAVAIYPAPGFTLDMVSNSVRAAILGVFARLNVGDTSLKVSDLRYAIGSVRGVIDHAFASPSSMANPLIAPITGTSANPGGVLSPTAVPVAGQTTITSTLVSGLWNIGYTFYTASGETALSPATTQTLATNNNLGITIAAITLPAGATGIRYYLKPPSGSVFGLSASNTTGSATTLTAFPSLTTNPPTLNTTGTPVPGATFLTAGNYQVSYAWATTGGQTVTSPVSANVPIVSGQAIVATIPGLVLDPVLAPTVSSTSVTSTLPSGAYSVGYSYYTAVGETVLSPVSAITLATSNNLGIVIGPLNVPTSATGIRYYVRNPAGVIYGLAGTNTNGAQITLIAPPNLSVTTPAVNTTGIMPAGADHINWYISSAPFTVTPTALALAGSSTANTITLPTLPTDTTKTVPTGNTSANIGGGTGKIIVPGTITITQGV